MASLLHVSVWTQAALDQADGGDAAAAEFDCEYVSLVNGSTYGPPPLIAPGRAKANTPAEPPTATLEDRVLYVNTTLVPVFEIVRVND